MIVRVLVGAGVAALAVLALWHPAPGPALSVLPASPGPYPAKNRGTAPRSSAIVVYVVGAVQKAGLYRLAPEARAADAVSAAGGLTALADPAGINLAEHVRDGDEVLVPLAGQAPAVSSHRSRAAHRRVAQAPPAAGVDVNTSDATALARVPGIGRAVAARIVEMRNRSGAFSSLDELLDVSGMTDARLERARPYLQPP